MVKPASTCSFIARTVRAYVGVWRSAFHCMGFGVRSAGAWGLGLGVWGLGLRGVGVGVLKALEMLRGVGLEGVGGAEACGSQSFGQAAQGNISSAGLGSRGGTLSGR